MRLWCSKLAENITTTRSNALDVMRAEAWRDNVGEWLRALVDVIETNGGAAGGHA